MFLSSRTRHQFVSFHLANIDSFSDGSVLPIDQCKCAQLLVKSDSLEVVDYIMHYGFGDTGIDPPYTSDWILADGKHKMYYITESGFFSV